MAQTCRKCGRVNPAEAAYCHYDGFILAGHAPANGPVSVGTQAFPNPFVFPTGQWCRNFNELALACQQEWPAARDLLKQGFLESFLGGLGRADLALAAREAARYPDPDRGLDQLLAKLPADTLDKPKLRVSPKEVNLGVLAVGQDRKFELRFENQGMRLIYGSVSADECDWLGFGEHGGAGEKLFEFGGEQVVPVVVRGKKLRAANKPLEGRLLVESSGGDVSVLVRAEVPVKPFPNGALAGAKSPRQVAEKAKTQPKEAAALFESGAVARWYESNGWSYPVQGEAASGIGAVQQFFEALGLTTPPKVEISERAVYLQGQAGERVEHVLKVRTQERRPVYAHAVSSQPWLKVGHVQHEGRSASVPLFVPEAPYRPGEPLQARVTVTANGNQRFVVTVTLVVRPGAPVSRPSAEAIPVAEAVAAPPSASIRAAPVVAATAPTAAPSPPSPPVGILVSAPVAATAVAVPILSASPPVAELSPRAFAAGGRRRARLWPLALLLAALGGVVGRDAFLVFVSEDAPVAIDPTPLLRVQFHDDKVHEQHLRTGEEREKFFPKGATMGFGLVMVRENNGGNGRQSKQLTFDAWGRSGNVCLRVDRQEYLFGPNDGTWEVRSAELDAGSFGRPRAGRRSVWLSPGRAVRVTQVAELVPGEQTRRMDTCLVRYTLESADGKAHEVGLRYLLDTYIGANDGVPFVIPGKDGLCDTQEVFDEARDVPDFIQALERESLRDPGTVAQVQFRVGGGLEAPGRVTLGAWPDQNLGPREARAQNTMWDVPVVPMKQLSPHDSAVTIYWGEKPLPPGQRRELGFAYGLGSVSSGESGGKIGLTVAGSFAPGGEFTLTALVSDPGPNETLTLTLPEGFRLTGDQATQAVPPPSNPSSRNSPVTWRIRGPSATGQYSLNVKSSEGAAQTIAVTIRQKRIF